MMYYLENAIWKYKVHFLASACFILQYFVYLCTHNIC